MSGIEIFGFAPSTYTQTALMVAREAGVDVSLKPLDFKQASHFALHPYGKMPALKHGDVQLFETLAIASYLDQAFGQSRLQPTNAADRARMLQWASVAIDYAYEDLVSQLLQDEAGAENVAAAAEQLKLLDTALGERAYFVGAQPTLADFLLFPMVEFAHGKLGDSCLQGLPALRAWHAAMAKRPSVVKMS